MMRIDLNGKLPQAVDHEKPVRRSSAAPNPASERPESGQDAARLSLHQQHLQTLEAGVNRLPEVRQERVTALQRVLQQGNYEVSSEQIAGAMMSEMLAGAGLIR